MVSKRVNFRETGNQNQTSELTPYLITRSSTPPETPVLYASKIKATHSTRLPLRSKTVNLLFPDPGQTTMNEADTRARASLPRATVAPPINALPSPFRRNPTAPRERPARVPTSPAACWCRWWSRSSASEFWPRVGVRRPLFAGSRQRPPEHTYKFICFTQPAVWLARFFQSQQVFMFAPFFFVTGRQSRPD